MKAKRPDESTIRDFIYLDLPRLQSFASQLLQGLPTAETRTAEHESTFEGEVRAGLPAFLGASANAQAVLSAGSSITSSVHHRLVGLVLEKLESLGFLDDRRLDDVGDGGFVTVSGQLQITDPTALREIFADWRTTERNVAALTSGPEAQPPSRADRRAGRAPSSGLNQTYVDALVSVLDKFGANTVRVRVVAGGATVAVGAVEREKFVDVSERQRCTEIAAKSAEASEVSRA